MKLCQRILRQNNKISESQEFDPIPYFDLRDRPDHSEGGIPPPPFKGTLIDDRIYLGGVSEAMYPSSLVERGIVGIINVAGLQCRDFQRMEKAMASESEGVVSQWERIEFRQEWYRNQTKVDGFKYLVIDAEDHPRYKMRDHFDACIDFLDCVEGNVLVHCVQGLNRSAAVLVAYLLKSTRRPLEDIIDEVSKKRAKILSNKSFLKELVVYEMELNGVLSINQDNKVLLRPPTGPKRIVEIGNIVERIV